MIILFLQYIYILLEDTGVTLGNTNSTITIITFLDWIQCTIILLFQAGRWLELFIALKSPAGTSALLLPTMSHQLQITDFIKLKATAVKAPLPLINAAAAAHLDCYILIISSHNLQYIKFYQLKHSLSKQLLAKRISFSWQKILGVMRWEGNSEGNPECFNKWPWGAEVWSPS